MGAPAAPERPADLASIVTSAARAVCTGGWRALFSAAFRAAGQPRPASQGHCPSQGRANSGGDTGEESLPPTGWSKVGGEPAGRRGQEMEFKAHSKRRAGPEASPLDRNAPVLPSL